MHLHVGVQYWMDRITIIMACIEMAYCTIVHNGVRLYRALEVTKKCIYLESFWRRAASNFLSH